MKKFLFLVISFIVFSLISFSQNVAIELDKMNVLYKFVDNPIKVVVQDYPCNKLILKSKYGNIKIAYDSCHYIYRTDSCYQYEDRIFVGVKDRDTVKWIDSLKYRLRKIPDPTILVGGMHEGYVNRNVILAIGFVGVALENIDVDIHYYVTKYSVEIKRADSTIYKEVDLIGEKFSSELISEIKKSKTNDKYIFYDVNVETNNRCGQKLMGPVLIIGNTQ